MFYYKQISEPHLICLRLVNKNVFTRDNFHDYHIVGIIGERETEKANKLVKIAMNQKKASTTRIIIRCGCVTNCARAIYQN